MVTHSSMPVGPHCQSSLAGYNQYGHEESDMTEATEQQASFCYGDCDQQCSMVPGI